MTRFPVESTLRLDRAWLRSLPLPIPDAWRRDSPRTLHPLTSRIPIPESVYAPTLHPADATAGGHIFIQKTSLSLSKYHRAPQFSSFRNRSLRRESVLRKMNYREKKISPQFANNIPRASCVACQRSNPLAPELFQDTKCSVSM